MIIVDTALQRREAEGRPIRVALVGAGFMGRGLVNQIVQLHARHDGGRDRQPHRGQGRARLRRGRRDRVPGRSSTRGRGRGGDRRRRPGRHRRLRGGRARPGRSTRSSTPPVRSSTAATWRCRAIEHGKHLVLMNAEVDGTVGPILSAARRGGRRRPHRLRRRPAGRADEPGPLRPRHRPPPLVCGNIKGLQDEYRTPTTQQGFAEKWGQDPYMVTSFADGTKISFEQAIVANATGMTVAKRGMRGADHHGHVDELTTHVRRRRAASSWAAWSTTSSAASRARACSCWPPTTTRSSGTTSTCTSSARARCTASTRRTTCATSRCRRRWPGRCCSVTRRSRRSARRRSRSSTTAKRDLKAGEVLDGLGGYDTYGVAERADVTAAENLLPMGVAEGCAAHARRGARTTCSPTPTSSCRRAAWSTSCGRRRRPSCPVRQLAGV